MEVRKFFFRIMRRRNIYGLITIAGVSLIITLWSVGLPSTSHNNRIEIRPQVMMEEFSSESWHDNQNKFPSNFVEGHRIKMNDDRLGHVEHILLPGFTEISDGDCIGLKGPRYLYANVFQPIDLHDQDNYVYSAFYDQRNDNHFVRVIGLMTLGQENHLFCQLWFISHGHISIDVEAALVESLDNNIQDASAIQSVEIACANRRKRQTPYFVSIVREKCKYGKNRLQVLTVMTRRPDRPSIAVCISPMRNKYGDVNAIMEAAVVNKLFGAEEIIVYNSSSTRQVRRLSQALVFDKVISLISWNLPNFGKSSLMPYFDEMAMRHDCLMRGMGLHRHLLYANFNEILVPRHDEKWSDVFSRHRLDHDTPSVITYNMIEFLKNLPIEYDAVLAKEIKAVKSTFLSKTKRVGKYFKPQSHSSYIIDPLQVRRLTMYNVGEEHFANARKEVVLWPDEVLLHRYTNISIDEKYPLIIDYNLLRFQSSILEELKTLRSKYHQLIQ